MPAATIINPAEPPAQESRFVKTDKGMAKQVTLPRAAFRSRYRQFRLGLVPVDTQVVQTPGGRTTSMTVAGSGVHVQFHDWKAVVEGEDKIKMCLAILAKGNTDFEIDEQDETGYWREHGYVTERTEMRNVREVVREKTITGANDPEDRATPTGRPRIDYPTDDPIPLRRIRKTGE